MFVLIVVIVIVATTIGLVVTGSLETGFEGKTLWDWIEVVGIPVVVVIIAVGFDLVSKRANERKNKEQRERDTEQAREATLRSYLDVMSNLILEKNLKNSVKGSPDRAVAHAHTFMVPRTLDGPRKGILLEFLKESGLIDRDKNVVSLDRANLTEAHLSYVDLSGSYLSGVNLMNADLYKANLSNADLSDSVLKGADLWEADLSNADLRNADLTDALVKREPLKKASDTSDALLPEVIDENPEEKES